MKAPLWEVWRQHGGKLRWLGVFYLAVAATGKLHYAFPHLLWQPEAWSALDVRYRYQEVAAWFAGNQVYGVVGSAVYPPATHAILWPLLGWVSIETARLFWAITIVVAGAALVFLLYRLAVPAAARDRLLVAGLVLACYPFQLSVMIGQLGVHVVALVACGAFLLFRARPRWWIDVVVAAMLACSLVKPTISVPLVAAVLIVSNRARPVALVVLVYAALTLVAASAQPSDLVTLFQDWHQRAGVRVPFEFGVINLHLLLWWAGLRSWMTPVSLLVLTVASAWTWLRRDARPWALLGVSAIVTGSGRTAPRSVTRSCSSPPSRCSRSRSVPHDHRLPVFARAGCSPRPGRPCSRPRGHSSSSLNLSYGPSTEVTRSYGPWCSSSSWESWSAIEYTHETYVSEECADRSRDDPKLPGRKADPLRAPRPGRRLLAV